MVKDDLINQVDRVGKGMATSVQQAAQKSKLATGARNVGSSFWIDTANHADAVDLHRSLRENGVLTRLNGASGVIARPALTLDEGHGGKLGQALSKC